MKRKSPTEQYREVAQEFSNLLKRAVTFEREAFDTDQDVNGGDLVEWFAEWRRDVRQALGRNGYGPSIRAVGLTDFDEVAA